jgi:hypothetical protein
VPPPALAIALGAATSCVDAPAPHLRSFNGNRPGKSSGVAAAGATLVAKVTNVALQIADKRFSPPRSSTTHKISATIELPQYLINRIELNCSLTFAVAIFFCLSAPAG